MRNRTGSIDPGDNAAFGGQSQGKTPAAPRLRQPLRPIRMSSKRLQRGGIVTDAAAVTRT